MLLKSRVLVAAIVLVMIFVIVFSTAVLAGRPTIKTRVAEESDCTVTPTGVMYKDATMHVAGDTSGNLSQRALFKFFLKGLQIRKMTSAQLELHIARSTTNGTTDYSPPCINPGLGDTRVIHIADYGKTPSAESYNSTGSDLGVLIAEGADGTETVTIDVTAAVEQAHSAKARYIAFRIQTDTSTDYDSEIDWWWFISAGNSDESLRPRLIINLQ